MALAGASTASFFFYFLVALLHLLAAISDRRLGGSAKPPPEPVQCGPGGRGCLISNTYGSWPDGEPHCRAGSASYPATEEELVAAVAAAVRRGQKLKVISKWAHSMPKLACPGGGGGGGGGHVISTRDYNRRIVVDPDRRTVEADAGVELRRLVDVAAAHGLALPYAPYWAGVSVAGLISTGAHGSSLYQKGGAVHEYVVGMRIVVPATPQQGYARVVAMAEEAGGDKEELLNAARVSLGVLGAISTVTLQLEPLFKQSVTNEKESDEDMAERLLGFASSYEFGDVMWYPSEKSVVYKKAFRVAMETEGDGANEFVGFQPQEVSVLEAVRELEMAFEETDRSGEGKCGVGRVQVASLQAMGNGLMNDRKVKDSFTGYPVIGLHNQMQTSDSCLRSPEMEEGRICSWDPRHNAMFFHQTTVSVGMAMVGAFIEDVKSLRRLRPHGFCGVDLYHGIVLRFIRRSAAFLGEEEEAAVSFDITYFRSRDPSRPRLDMDIWEEIEQIALFKYSARPHWGKNRPVGFIGAASKYPRLSRFLAVKDRLDPSGLFSSEWSDGLLGLGPLPLSQADGCALDGLCICDRDAHCAPHLGYRCQPGLVYAEARVCRKVDGDGDGQGQGQGHGQAQGQGQGQHHGHGHDHEVETCDHDDHDERDTQTCRA